MPDPVRTAIVALLTGIADIGKVHSYERYSSRKSTLAAFYSYQGQLRGWFVRRGPVIETSPSDSGRRMETINWQIRGYMALDDSAATEQTFDDLLDAIRSVFRADETLGGTVFCTVHDKQAGVAVIDSGPVLFASVLCHSAQLSFITKRYF